MRSFISVSLLSTKCWLDNLKKRKSGTANSLADYYEIERQVLIATAKTMIPQKKKKASPRMK